VDRLPPSRTQRIDVDRPIGFHWVRRNLVGYEGDTVATALWAADVRVFGRSFEYHRPRGLYDLEGEGSSQLLAINGVPNQSSGTTPLREGMFVTAQNVKGDPRFDRYGWLDRFDRWMPAGFYYKVFHRPYRAWPFFQNRMRKLAGLGVLDIERAPPHRKGSELYLNAEVAVIGGGAAGMSAALSAARPGIRVCLFERRPWLGGHLDWRVRERTGTPLYEYTRQLAARVHEHPGIRVFEGAPVTGVWGENLVTGFQNGSGTDGFEERHWECRAQAVVVATGSIERPFIFKNNDRPGILQLDTAWRLARTYGVRPGNVITFSVGDDLSLEAALDFSTLGLDVPVVADARSDGHDPDLVHQIQQAGIEFLPGYAASEVHGKSCVRGVDLGPLDGGKMRRFACDVLVTNAGRQPDIGVLSCAGARFGHSEHTHTFQLASLPLNVFAAGRVLGLVDVDAIETSGRIAGLEAVEACGCDTDSYLESARGRMRNLPGAPPGCDILYGPRIGGGRKAFLDFDEDGTWKNVAQCAGQGFDVPELAKRFGNFGLGPGQYRVPGQNLAMAMTEIAGHAAEEVTSTTVRPPVIPTTIGTVAGPNHDVCKRTPLHDDQSAHGGVFRRAGAWQRARYFSDDFMCREEIRNVRENVGLLDSSPLGKFRIYGPDAVKALQRVFISDMSRMTVDRCKYSAMCNDTGNIIDDGVVVPVGDNDFYFTTSSNRAGETVEWFRYHTRYDGWDYNLVNLTDGLASINVAGPNARRVLQKITSANISNEAFPYLGYRKISVGEDVPARCLRLGFVGELSYELHVGASYAQYVWDLLWEAGQEFSVRPFGVEAQYCMRAEKGHVIIGAESEQRVTLLDIGMGWLWDQDDTESKKVGAPALRACFEQTGRMKLIGFLADGPDHRPKDGAIVVDGDDVAGFVCTTRYSEVLGSQFGMALVDERLAVEGEKIHLYENLGSGTKRCAVTVVRPHFYDPDGGRLRA